MENITSGNNFRYTVFFDLDHTIISKISGKEIVHAAIRKGYLKPLDLAFTGINYLLYKISFISSESMAERLIRWTKGIPLKIFNDLCAETTLNILLPSVFPEALKEIEFHRKKEARLVLLSASADQVCKIIAEKTGFDDIICTSLIIRDEFLTGGTKGLCFGEEKGKRLREYCFENNIILSESFYYGDSYSDIPVFIQVGNQVCVNPGPKLKKTAVAKGWKTLLWSS